MDKLGRGYRPKNEFGLKEMNVLNGDDHTLLVIKLPDSKVMRIISRSLFLAMMLLALPSIGSMIGGGGGSDGAVYEHDDVVSGGYDGGKILPVLLRDLVDEGLIRKGDKGFVLGARDGDFEFLREAGVDLLTGADVKGDEMGARRVFDFMFVPNFRGLNVIDDGLKDGGLVISTLGADPSDELRLLTSFKIVYLRRFESTVIAMRKSNGIADLDANSNRVLCGVTPEKKKAALKGLEDVYLEPPRRSALSRKSKKSSFTSRKIKYLPDLLKDSLDEYPRRVFISDDAKALDWFYKNYPMRDQVFEVYHMEVGVDDDGSSKGVKPRETKIDWITKNLKPEDYVVMKAEAQVVEEMLKDKTLCLVDELFLECKNQWQDGGEEEENGSKRAYWQCLALYGKVRDEGIAVHQWWY